MATTKNVFGLGPDYYKREMRWLKSLRNKIHIQSPLGMDESDYTVFENIDVLNHSKLILWHFLQKSLSMPTDKMNDIFYFLLTTKDFIHSKKD
jgi:hypothetical protein